MSSVRCLSCGHLFERSGHSNQLVECPRCHTPIFAFNSSEDSPDADGEPESVELLGLDELEPGGMDEAGFADLELAEFESGQLAREDPLALAADDPIAPHDNERLQRIAEVASQSQRRATPFWLGLLDQLGIGEGRFQSSRAEMYRVLVAPDTIYLLDVPGIRELLLSGHLDRETWIRPVVAGEEEGEPGGMRVETGALDGIHAGASDDQIRAMLAVDQLQSASPRDAGSSSVPKSGADVDTNWRRIGTSLAKTEYAIQSLYRPVLAHVRVGESIGFVTAAVLLAILPFAGGGIVKTSEEGLPGLGKYLLGLVAFLLVLAVVTAVSFGWTYLASKSQVVLFLTFLFFGCSPFLVALAIAASLGLFALVIYVLASLSGSFPGASIGLLLGIVRSPFLPRAPTTGDQKSAIPRDLKPSSEPKFYSLPLARLAAGPLTVVVATVVIAFTVNADRIDLAHRLQLPELQEMLDEGDAEVVADTDDQEELTSKDSQDRPLEPPAPATDVAATDRGGPALQAGEDSSIPVDSATDPQAGEPLREWVDASGQYRIQARFVALEETAVVLEREDKEVVRVPLERLSTDDQTYAKSRSVEAEPTNPQSGP